MLLCLDYDGVIVDSFDHLLRAAVQAQAALGHGRVPTAEDFRTIANLTFVDLAACIEIPREHWRAYAQAFDRHLLATADHTAMFPEMGPILRALAAGSALCVVTANMREVVTAKLAASGLEGVVSLVLGSEQPGSKTDKIRAAMAHFAASPQETWMVGDSRGDIRHGRAAGVRTAAVTWGYQPAAVLALEHPHRTISSPAQLLTLSDPS
ncbi:MAG: HAD family hydrolase [Ectothiorhodospiraceae bacterium]|nr:HAD family hydrolase [Ectothiorhodospiraceae bacterium]